MPTTRRFERILLEAVERTRTRLLAYCLMRNHWHLVVWPKQDGELSQFVGGLTLTHTQRWHAFRASRSGLARSREFATDRGRTGGVATVRRSRQPVRQRRMDRADHPQAGPGIDDPPPRPAQKVAQRFLTPFRCPQETRRGVLGDRGGSRARTVRAELRAVPLVPQPVFRTRVDGACSRRVLRTCDLGLSAAPGTGQQGVQVLLLVVD